jgi:hypothetical protein
MARFAWILVAGACAALAACDGGSPPAVAGADLPGQEAAADAAEGTEETDLPWQEGWACRPGETQCLGSVFLTCREDGSDWTTVKCPPGYACSPAGCVLTGPDAATGEDPAVGDGDVATPETDEGTPDPAGDEAVSDPPGPDAPVTECKPGDTTTVACGLNGKGKAVKECVDGKWAMAGHCEDPDVCKDDATQTVACGFNGNGTATDTCVAGQWKSGACADPDACKDGKTQDLPCEGGAGTYLQECQEGQWVTVSGCSKPGRWTCQDNVCTPSYDAPGCGDGTCYLSQGESNQSCPADCDFSGVAGDGQPCESAIQCVFYDWPAGTIGYWECSGWPWDRHCHVIEDDSYCGTPGQDYCYRDQQYAETPASCPADCPGSLSCGSAADCVLHDWPANVL